MALTAADRDYINQQFETLQNNMQAQITRVEGEVQAVKRDLRGYNGNDGLITNIRLLQNQVTGLETMQFTANQKFGEHLKSDDDFREKTNSAFALIKTVPTPKPPTKGKFGSWAWFRDHLDTIAWVLISMVVIETIIQVMGTQALASLVK